MRDFAQFHRLQIHGASFFRQLTYHLHNLRLVVPDDCRQFSILLDHTRSLDLPALPLFQSTVYARRQQPYLADCLAAKGILTTGGLNLPLSSASLLIASPSSLAPATISLALLAPTYSRILRNWSLVGGSSVMSNSNSVRCSLFWWVWSAAWSSVAVSDACAEACLRIVWTRIEAGREGLWNRVITSRDLCYMRNSVSGVCVRLGLILTNRNIAIAFQN